jgi:hypothetical protein
MVVYETFEHWFDETEGYGFRSERFFQHLEAIIDDEPRRSEFITNWMRAAFEAGRNPGDKYV